MHNPNIISGALATALVCVPVWTHSGSISLHETTLSAAADAPCHASPHDQTVGKLVYYKGEATVNGVEPTVGVSVRNGDVLTTSHDGFVALALHNGNLVSIQPVTHLSVACTTETATEDPY